jgi:hypothetical protein
MLVGMEKLCQNQVFYDYLLVNEVDKFVCCDV